MSGESDMEASTPPRVTQPAQRNLLQDSGDSNPGSVTTQKGGKGWEVGGRLAREGTCGCMAETNTIL